MTVETLSTKDRILQAAIQLFLDQGIRRVSMDEVADRCGVSRVTLYRYFADREALVRAAFFAPIEALEQLQTELVAEDDPTVEGVLGAIGERIAEQPAIDLPVHRDELEKLYPPFAALDVDLPADVASKSAALYSHLLGRMNAITKEEMSYDGK